jgi:raffinose/stachyose/melibiose transport system substrate-binding protein
MPIFQIVVLNSLRLHEVDGFHERKISRMKKATKFAAIAIASALVLSGTAAPASAAGTCSKKTAITMLGTIKPEIKEQFLNAVKAYNASQSCYTLTNILGDRALTFLQNVTPMYAAKKAPTIMYTLQEIPDMASKVMDWKGTKLASLAPSGLLATATVGGKLVGVPSTAEAFGLIYNKKVLTKAGVDPKEITTRAELEEAFIAIEKTGAKAVRFSSIWWSLGAHVTNVYFANAAKTHEGRLANLDALANGKKKLANDPVFKNWAATFELFKKYNSDKTQTIDATGDSEYASAVAELASSKVGFWFMGNWAEPSLMAKAPDAVDFGLIPVPISNDAKAYGNNSISVGVPGYFMVDKVQSTADQRKGAIDFLTWLYTSDKGQHFVADSVDDGGMGFIPVYKGFKVEPVTFMSKEISKYVTANRTLEWINSYYPAGGQNKYGASGQKLWSSKINSTQYAAEIEKAWKGVAKTWRGAKK